MALGHVVKSQRCTPTVFQPNKSLQGQLQRGNNTERSRFKSKVPHFNDITSKEHLTPHHHHRQSLQICKLIYSPSLDSLNKVAELPKWGPFTPDPETVHISHISGLRCTWEKAQRFIHKICHLVTKWSLMSMQKVTTFYYCCQASRTCGTGINNSSLRKLILQLQNSQACLCWF